MAVIWITGARGFIGRHLSTCVASRGDRVSGLGHGAWPDADAGKWGVDHWINGDIHASNLQTLKQKTGAPDFVFHLAGGSSVGMALTAPHEDFTRTVVSTANLLEWVRQESPRSVTVVASSAAVYGAGHEGPIAESAIPSPYSPYGQHKLMMENLCRSYGTSYGLQTVVARLFSVYGPGLKKQLLWDLCARLKAEGGDIELGGTGRELRDWVEVSDAARALDHVRDFSLIDAPVFNVGTAQPVSVRNVSECVLAAWPNVSAVGFSGKQRAGDPFSLVADNRRLLATGFAFKVQADEGIRRYVEWYLHQGEGAV